MSQKLWRALCGVSWIRRRTLEREIADGYARPALQAHQKLCTMCDLGSRHPAMIAWRVERALCAPVEG